MEWDKFFIGIIFLLLAYFFYKTTKGKLASEKSDWKGLTLSLYVQGWGVVVLCLILGMGFIIKSWPGKIN